MNKVKKDMDNNRESAFDCLRGFSACGVIFIHVCAMQWKTVDVYSAQWTLIHFYDMLMKFSVPVFFMISGRFFLDLSRKMSLRKLLNKILHIIIVFLFWTSVYTFLNIYRVIKDGGDLKENITWIIIEFFKGEYHMWFLYAIIGLYLITPLLRKIVESKWLTEFFLVLFLIFGLIWPLAEQLPKVGVLFINAGNSMVFNMTTGYVGYYMLGYYLYRYPIKAKKKWLLYILGIVGTIFSITSTLIVSWKTGVASEKLASYLTVNVALTSAALYTAVLNCMKNKKGNKVIMLISKYSFGCYLAHPFFLWIFEWIGFMPSVFCAAISVPIISACVLSLSLLLTIVLGKIPYLRRVI